MDINKITLNIDYNTKAGKSFSGYLYSGIELNYFFVKIGSEELLKSIPHLPVEIPHSYFYMSMRNFAVSLLENFFVDLLIEKIEDISTKDELNEKIKQDFKYRNKQVSFQILDDVNKYIQRYIKSDFNMADYHSYQELKLIYNIRHISTHNLGKIDKKFRDKSSKFLEESPNAVAILPWEGSFVKDLTLLQAFVKYIEDHI